MLVLVLVITPCLLYAYCRKSKPWRVVVIATAKLLVVIMASMSLNDWWKFHGAEFNNDAVSSCASTDQTTCHTFCDTDPSLTLVTVNDDYSRSHYTTSGYCSITLTQSCAYTFWMVFRLVPIVLHVIQLLLQCICLYKYRHFVPQQIQFDLIAERMLGLGLGIRMGNIDEESMVHKAQGNVVCSDSSDNSTNATVSNPDTKTSPETENVIGVKALIVELCDPPVFSIFAFIELVTVLYVWTELLYPPIDCNAVNPLSYYYYPLLMTLFEIYKMNAYLVMRYFARGDLWQCLLVSFDMEVLFTHAFITAMLGILFLPNILLNGIESKYSSQDGGVTVGVEDKGTITSDNTVNPMMNDSIHKNKVELTRLTDV